MFITLLQAVPATPAITDSTTTVIKKSIPVLELVGKGGWIMLPIFLLSFLAVYLFITKLLVIQKANAGDDNFIANVKVFLQDGKLEGASAMCKGNGGVVPKMVDKGISVLGSSAEDIEKNMEAIGRIELMKAEKNINLLSLIASIAPILGFIGTIMGVIEIFYDMAGESDNSIKISTIADGLYKKMVTSASGLVVGLLAYSFFHILQWQLEKLTLQMENGLQLFMDFIYKNKKR